jgi:dolichol-phosphate mannosyltransferase
VLELAVVVPTLDERDNVVELIRRLETVLAGVDYEVVVVDDDSADGTPAAVRALALRDRRVRLLQRVGRRGLSSACIEGMLATAAPVVAVMDADLQHDETILPAMLAKLKAENLDLVVGTRASSDEGFGLSRQRLSAFGKRLSGIIGRHQLSDPMSGFFVLDRRYFDEVVHSLSAVGFKILLDFVASSQRPVRIGEVPYRFRSRLHGESKLDIVVGLEYLQLLADKLIGGLVPPRFVLFALVGSLGVLLHLGVLYVMLAWLPFGWAQLVATVVVMTTNFFLNNAFTWRDYRLRGAAAFVGLLKFYAACSIGALLNLALASQIKDYGAPWYVAGFAGLIVGSVWNFAVTAATTWRRRRARRARGSD